jgi:hypothetical protein
MRDDWIPSPSDLGPDPEPLGLRATVSDRRPELELPAAMLDDVAWGPLVVMTADGPEEIPWPRLDTPS